MTNFTISWSIRSAVIGHSDSYRIAHNFWFQVSDNCIYHDMVRWVTSNAVDNFQRWITLMKGDCDSTLILIGRVSQLTRQPKTNAPPIPSSMHLLLLYFPCVFHLPWVWYCAGMRRDVGNSTIWLLPGITSIKTTKTDIVTNPRKSIRDRRTIWS